MAMLQNALHKVWTWTKGVLSDSVSVLLTAMFVVVLAFVVFILAALQFRDTMQNSTEPKLNAGRVRQSVSFLEWRENVESDLQKKRDERLDLDDKLFALQQSVYTDVRKATDVFTDPALSAIQFPSGNDAANYLKIREVFQAYRAQALDAIHGNSDAHFRDYARKVLGTITDAVNQKLDGYDAMVEADNSLYYKIEETAKQLPEIDKKIDSGFADELQRAQFRGFCEELLTYESVFGRMAYEMIFMPKSSLTLMLAVVMGLLGSLIYLARERVIDETKVGFSVIVFRASLGGALAVAIYVFAAAGMVAIGQHPAGGDGSGIEMSPYLISFIGITAGYLSEHMAAWMAQVGRDTFKVNGVESKERWATHLASELGAKTPASIAQALNVPQTQVDSWVALNNPVPPDLQPLLAVYLDLDISEMFTDIPPRARRAA